MNTQRDRYPGLILFLLATFGGPILSAAAREQSAPERLPLPTEPAVKTPLVDALGDPLPPGAVARLGSTRWRHGERINTLAFSQNGKRIASSSWDDSTVRIWDAESGQMLHKFKLNTVNALALSEDGKSLAAIARDSSGEGLAVWVWKEGTDIPRQLVKKTKPVYCLLFQEGQLWIGWQGGITCWDLKHDKQLVEYQHPTPTFVTALAYYGGAKPMIAAATDFGVLVLKASGEKVADAPISTKDFATTVAFAPDGKSVAVGTDSGFLYVWSIKDGVLVKRHDLHPHRAGVTSITYSPDGKKILSVSHAGDCYRSDAVTGDKVARVFVRGAPPGDTDAPRTPALVFSPDGQRLAGRLGLGREGADDRLHVWETLKGEELSRPVGHSSAVENMAFQSDGSFVSFSTTGELILWNTKHAPVLRREMSNTGTKKSVALSSDGRMVLFPNAGVELYDLKDLARPERLSTNKETLYYAKFSPDADVLVTAQYGSLGFWSNKNKSLAAVDLSRDWAYTLAFSGDGKRLILTNQMVTVQVWNVASRTKICDLKNVRSDDPIALSPHGQIAAVWSKKGRLQFFDATSGDELPTSHEMLETAKDFVFTPDGRTLIVATENGVRFVEALTGRELLGLDGGQGEVQCLAINRDGTLLATGGADATVLFWDLRRILHTGLFARGADAALARTKGISLVGPGLA